MPSYLIDVNTAIKVIDSNIEVISEGQWKLVTPEITTNREHCIGAYGGAHKSSTKIANNTFDKFQDNTY